MVHGEWESTGAPGAEDSNSGKKVRKEDTTTNLSEFTILARTASDVIFAFITCVYEL